MLSSVRSGSSDRTRQSLLLLQHLKHLEALKDPANDDLLKVQKGMFFVSLYACLEYTLTTAVSEFLAKLQAAPLPAQRYQIGLLPSLLSAEFNAVSSGAKRALWENKLKLIRKVFSPDACSIDNSVFPADGINISVKHFKAIWEHLHLPGDPIPTGVSPWVIDEIKDHRNAIAHGRERAAAIGARFTIGTLEDRYNAVETLCTNTIMSVEDHLLKQTYLLPP